MPVYADTGAFIALYEPRDGNHDDARRTLERLTAEDEQLVTGWHTVVEFIDGVAHHYDQARAAEVLGALLSSARLRIVPSEPHRDEAIATLRSRPTWNVDLSDCLSFAVMTDAGIGHVFGYDADFTKAGFERVG